METKYLSDGRKVVVIGRLNNVESIVQEVFVSDSGDQIPSGEKFTTKNLHDDPVKPWKQKEVEKFEAMYDKARKDIKDIEKELRVMKSKRQGHSEIIAANLKMIDGIENMSSIDLEFFSDVITGNILWVIDGKWNWDKPTRFDEKIYSWDSYCGDKRYEGVRMIKVMGVSRGKFRFDISTYSDGSGNDGYFDFFNSDTQMKEFLINKYKKKHQEGKLTADNINNISKFITVDQTVVDEVLAAERKGNKDRFDNAIKHSRDAFDKRELEISKLIR